MSRIQDNMKKHRGRFQAQGGGVEESEAQAQDEPLTKTDGLELLGRLEGKLSKKEQEKRERQFRQAERFVKNAQSLYAPKGKSFFHPTEKNVSIDIEVKGGVAFVCMTFIMLVLLFLLIAENS